MNAELSFEVFAVSSKPHHSPVKVPLRLCAKASTDMLDLGGCGSSALSGSLKISSLPVQQPR